MAHTQPGYITDKQALLNRLKRIEGQVRGVQRLVTEDVVCTEILVQIAASTRALEGVALSLLDQHLHHCVADAAGASQTEVEQKIAEASAAIARLVRS